MLTEVIIIGLGFWQPLKLSVCDFVESSEISYTTTIASYLEPSCMLMHKNVESSEISYTTTIASYLEPSCMLMHKNPSL
jgi:hypothetical protein